MKAYIISDSIDGAANVKNGVSMDLLEKKQCGMSELKPCPFCGIELIKLAEKLYQHPKNDCWESSAYVDGDEAIEAWNRRVKE